VRDHGIVERVGVFGDVEIFLDGAAGVREKRPVGVDASAVFICFGDVVGADGDEAAIGDFEFAMELHEEFGLAAIFGAEASAAEDQNHGMRALEVGEFAVLGGVVGKVVVGKCGAGNDVGSHGNTSGNWMRGEGPGLSDLLKERIENEVEQKVQG